MPLPPHLADLEARIRARFDAAVEDLRGQYEARLRQASESMISAVAELRPSGDPLEGLVAPDVEAAPRAAGRDEALASLLEAARAIDRAATQSEVLAALLSGVRGFAARAGLLLARGTALTGWGSDGFAGEPFGGRELGWDGAALERLAGGRGAVRLGSDEAADLTRRLGASPGDGDAVLVPLVLRDRIAAALYADGAAGRPLELPALQLLVAIAAARIELAPLTTRAFTPTLYAEERAPGAGLPLWSGVAGAAATVAAAPAPAPVAAIPAAPAAVEVEPAAYEPHPIEPEPELPAFEPEPSDAAPEPMSAERSEVERLFAAEPASWSAPEPTAEPVAEPEIAFEPEPSFEPAAPEPTTDDSLWGAREAPVEAADAGFEIEAVPEPPAPVAPPLGEATVRIPVFRPEPTPAPVEEISGTLGFGGSATQEVPRLGTPMPTPAPPPAFDSSEDATMLMSRAAAVEPTRAPVPPPPAAEAPEEDTHDRTAARPGGAKTTEVAPPPDVRGPGLAFAAGRTARSTGENALHEEAKRLARLLVSEIKLYNEEQVLEGRRNRDLYVRLREDIDRSRQIYEERVHESVRTDSDYFHQELVRSLAGGDARALGM